MWFRIGRGLLEEFSLCQAMLLLSIFIYYSRLQNVANIMQKSQKRYNLSSLLLHRKF
jgi:hypothetical protein